MTEEQVTDLEMNADATELEAQGVSEEDAEIIARAKKNFNIAQESESDIRKEALEDYKFRAGQQWPEEIKNARDQDKRPCLTVNQLPQFVNQIVNDLRQNRPAIKIDPTGNGATEETAEVMQGICRHIEYASNADIAYDRGADSQVTGGFGFWRIVTEYASETSFDLECRIKSVRNPFSVLLDPSYSEPDGSDSNWGHVFDSVSKAEYKALYPNSKLSSMADWTSIGNNSEGWVSKDGCRITEYFEKVWKKANLFLLNTGDTIFEEDLPPELPAGVEIMRTSDGKPISREALKASVKWYKMNGIEILEREDFPSKYIPIIPILGTEMIIEGERILEGIVRHARDPQRMYNFFASYEAETIALAPKAPWIGFAGQFEGHEEKWETANTRNHAFLEVNETTLAGKPAAMPTRNVYEPPVQAITGARMASAGDLKTTTGIYDPTLGNRSNEQSGVAIQRRIGQSQTSNFHFADNMARSVRHTGRILIDMIPKVYDTPRAVRIIDEEDKQKMVWVNKIFQDQGENKIHKLDVGTYDVTVSQGPSYQTKRQEFVASVLELVRATPALMGTIGDLLVSHMDWPGKDAIAERLEKMLPPQLQKTPDGQQPLPPQVQAQMSQAQAIMKNQAALIAKQDEIIKNKQMELSSKERIAMAEIQADIEINLAKLGHASAETMLDHQVGQIERRQDMIGQNQPIGTGSGVGGNAALPNSNQTSPTGGNPPGSNPME